MPLVEMLLYVGLCVLTFGGARRFGSPSKYAPAKAYFNILNRLGLCVTHERTDTTRYYNSKCLAKLRCVANK